MALPDFGEAIHQAQNKVSRIRETESRRLSELAYQRRLAEAPDPRTLPAVIEARERNQERIVRALGVILPALRLHVSPELELITPQVADKVASRRQPRTMGQLIHGYSSKRRDRRTQAYVDRHVVPGWQLHEGYETPGITDGDPIDRGRPQRYDFVLGDNGQFYSMEHGKTKTRVAVDEVHYGTHEHAGHHDAKLFLGLANLVVLHELPVDPSSL